MTSRTTTGMGMDEGGNDGLMHSDGVARERRGFRSYSWYVKLLHD